MRKQERSWKQTEKHNVSIREKKIKIHKNKKIDYYVLSTHILITFFKY